MNGETVEKTLFSSYSPFYGVWDWDGEKAAKTFLFWFLFSQGCGELNTKQPRKLCFPSTLFSQGYGELNSQENFVFLIFSFLRGVGLGGEKPRKLSYFGFYFLKGVVN